MTIRDYIKRRIRGPAAIGLVGWLVAAAAAQVLKPPADDVAIALGALFFGFGALSYLRLRCPRCHNRIGGIIGFAVALSIRNPPNNCPYCGVSLDEEMN